jgi:hypothetical protein
MRVYSVHRPPVGGTHTPPAAREAGPLLIREGFSWGAFFFGPLWLLAQRLWLAALAWLVLVVLASLLSPWAGLGLQFLLAAEARNLRRWTLARRGWREVGVVAAPDQAWATQRLLDTPGAFAA